MRYLFPLSPYNQQRQYEKPVWVFPAHLAMYATYLRNNGHHVIWKDPDGEWRKPWRSPWNDLDEKMEKLCLGDIDKVVKDDFDIDIPFIDLPFPDREFTDAKNPRWQSYGNYKFHPATHMMASNLCRS